MIRIVNKAFHQSAKDIEKRINKYKTIINAILKGSLNIDLHSDRKWFMWHKRELRIEPYHINHLYEDEHQRGVFIYDKSEPKYHLDYDFDVQPSFIIIGADGLSYLCYYTQED